MPDNSFSLYLRINSTNSIPYCLTVTQHTVTSEQATQPSDNKLLISIVFVSTAALYKTSPKQYRLPTQPTDLMVVYQCWSVKADKEIIFYVFFQPVDVPNSGGPLDIHKISTKKILSRILFGDLICYGFECWQITHLVNI